MPSLTTPPERERLACQICRPHAAFVFRLQTRPPEFRTHEATLRLPHYGLVTRCHPMDGFVSGLQKSRFPSFLPLKLRRLWLFLRWD